MIELIDGEKILLIKRKHWLIITLEGFGLLLLTATPFVVALTFFILSETARDILESYLPFVIFYGTIWVQFLLIVFFISWTNYYLDALIITSKRIIDVEQIGLFARDIAETRLENVQDIKIEVLGILASLLKMGDIHIQTAAQNKEIFIKNMPNPNEIREEISKHQNEAIKKREINPSDTSETTRIFK